MATDANSPGANNRHITTQIPPRQKEAQTALTLKDH